MTEDAVHGNSNENVQMDSLERDPDCESNSPINPNNITEELSHSNGETDKNVEEDSEIELYSCNDNEEVNSEKETNMDSIRKYQTTKQSATMMCNNFPEIGISEPTNTNDTANDNNSSSDTDQNKQNTESHAIAPGEGKVPSNLMRDKNWDVNAFPSFHPSGKFGLHYTREKKLTPQQHFIQRLQNVNRRFSSHPPYVFAAQYYIERHQLEQNINISFLKGKLSHGNLLQLDDSFAVFDKIPGTPKYWLNKRYELIAKLENLGAFHFFFTLSMADMRWPEIVTSILMQQGQNVVFSSDNNNPDISSITING